MLDKAKQLPGLSTGMSETISIAGTLFDGKVPLMQRAKFLSGNTVAVQIALDWDSASLIGTAASWFTLTPPMQTITMDTLYKLGALFNEAVEQLSVQVKCPVLHSTLCFGGAAIIGPRGLDQAARGNGGVQPPGPPRPHRPALRRGRDFQ